MIRSFFAGALVLLCVTVFEAAVLSSISFLPAVPDLSLICVLFFAVHNGRMLGEGAGFLSGLFLDVLSACPLGLNCLLRTVLGYSAGIFNRTLNVEGFLVPVLLGGCATLLKALLVLLISFLFPLTVVPYSLFSFEFLFELAANSVLSPFVFKFLGLFKNAVILKPEHVF
ncbi:MAG: rod shape-determining protein MreD [Treponema sp.]|nr:rod shape-determining protein MreD [Treponema sp.]